MELMSIEYLVQNLLESEKSSLAERIGMLVLVVYMIRKHLKKVEIGISAVASSVKDLAASLHDLKTDHGKRISVLESNVDKLSTK